MPYRLSPRKRNVVQVKRNGRWQKLKQHRTVAAARRHVRALGLNVSRKKGHKR